MNIVNRRVASAARRRGLCRASARRGNATWDRSWAARHGQGDPETRSIPIDVEHVGASGRADAPRRAPYVRSLAAALGSTFTPANHGRRLCSVVQSETSQLVCVFLSEQASEYIVNSSDSVPGARNQWVYVLSSEQALERIAEHIVDNSVPRVMEETVEVTLSGASCAGCLVSDFGSAS